MKPNRMWGGYSEGKLDLIDVDTGWGGFGTGSFARMPAIFSSRKAARERYQDVRPVELPKTRSQKSVQSETLARIDVSKQPTT